MADPRKLREKGRKLEQAQRWEEALGVYERVLEMADGQEVDPAFWNRVGDLRARLGDTTAAVEAYEHAVDAYSEAALHNNAIALCKKVLRLVPGRIPVYLRLGRLSAANGFLGDARESFVAYAERASRAGQIDASLDALKEFADISPGDSEVRLLLAEQLHSHDRSDEAVEQLRHVLSEMEARGAMAEAEDVRDRIRSIDPAADTSALAPRARPAAEEAAGYGLSWDAPEDEDIEDTEVESFDDAGVELDGEIDPVPGLEASGVEDVPEEAEPLSLEGLEETALQGADPDDVDDLPLLDIDAGPGPGMDDVADRAHAPGGEADAESPELEPGDELTISGLETFESVDAGGAESEAGPGVEEGEQAATVDDAGVDDPAEDGAGEPRYGEELVLEPETEGDPEAPPSPADGFAEEATAPQPARLEERLEEDPIPPEAVADLGERLEDPHAGGGWVGTARDVVSRLGQRERFAEGISLLRGIIPHAPRDTGLYQKQVELAFRSGTPDALVTAYLDLARHFRDAGTTDKARAVFERVLEVEPDNQEARAALAPPAAEAPAAEEYVDLGALILDDEDEGDGETTRFTVPEEEPSGDEEKDFAEMLSRFKQKVSANIDAEDSTSHYDLGLAYKDMGLMDEAISQFQVALRGGANPLATLEVLGQCFIEKGQHAVAARVLQRALQIPANDSDLVGVLYNLGRCEEAAGRVDEASEHYQRVLATDFSFRDTAERLEALPGSRS